MFALLISPKTLLAHMCYTSLNGLNVTTGRKRASVYLKCHRTYCKQVTTLQGADALKCPTRRCGEVRKEAKRWVRAKPRCKTLFVAGSLLNVLSTDKGIVNSHVNLSPIKLSAEGSVGWNSKVKAPWSHAQGENNWEGLLADESKSKCASALALSACRLTFTSVPSVSYPAILLSCVLRLHLKDSKT